MNHEKITLKGIKFAEFASEETYCYEASIYYNGKRVGTSRNDGHGGCDYQHVVNEQGWRDMLAYIDEQNELKTKAEKGAALRKHFEWLKSIGDDAYFELEQSNEDLFDMYAEQQYREGETWWEAAQRFNNADLERICHDRVTDWLYERDAKKMTRGKVAFFEGTFNGGYSYYPVRKGTPENVVVDMVRAKHPKATIINTLPMAERVALLRG